MSKTNPRIDDTDYVSLDSLTPFERVVFELALAALSKPLTARQRWFLAAAKAMRDADE